jgi:hypothetical protein
MSAGLPLPSTDENISTTLSSGITDVAGSMDVADGSKIPTVCYLVIDRVDSAGTLKATSLWEYVKVTNVAGNTLTITRAQGGSTGQAHSSGAVVEAVVTSSMFEDWYNALNPEHTPTGTHILSTATITTHLSVSGASISGGLVTLDTTQTLTNKTLTSPVINTPTGDVATLTGTQALTNKTLGAGTTDATDYAPTSIVGGNTTTVRSRKTAGVSTSAVIILATIGYLTFALVTGTDGTNRFSDVVLMSVGTGTINVISSLDAAGTPAARTYSQASSSFKLLVASGTYTVSVFAFTISP